MKNILLVEDEEVIRDFIVVNLKRIGYEVTALDNGEDAINTFNENPNKFQIAILDIMINGTKDGLEVCREIRKKDDKIGIIMLSAKAQEMDKISGFMMGADDYVTKPFNPSELIARIDSINRRVSMIIEEDNKDKLISGPFILDFKSKAVYKNGNELDLTQIEFHILEFFMKNPDIAKTRQEILSNVWGDGHDGDLKTVDVNIRRLRIKIEDDPSNPEYLLTIWGHGYRWSIPKG